MNYKDGQPMKIIFHFQDKLRNNYEHIKQLAVTLNS